MIIEAIATGRTVEAAIEAACEELGFSSEDVEIEILDLPRKEFFGLKVVQAKVRAFKEIADPAPEPNVEKVSKPTTKNEQPSRRVENSTLSKDSPVPKPAFRDKSSESQTVSDFRKDTKENEEALFGSVDDLSDKAKMAFKYFTDVLQAMGISTDKVTAMERENVIHLKLMGEETGAAIGRRGETLDALQYLTSLATNKSGEDYCRVILDSGNYRDKRKHTLEQLAKRLAINAIKSGRATTLEPMNPYERRIIHATVAEIAGASSSSAGEEPNRCVVISSANDSGKPPFSAASSSSRPPRRDFKSGPRGPRRDDRSRGGSGDRNRDKPEPYKESSTREVAPTEAGDRPLYGKIDI